MKKIALITGASSGIGKSTSFELIKDGYIVYGAARRVNKMADIEQAGGKLVELDVTNSAQIDQAVAQIIEEQGRIDVLFNNAGYALTGSVEEVSIEDGRRQFDVNCFGVVELTKQVLPYMRKQRSGTIINTSSVVGKIYGPLNSWYSSSKFALEGWSDCLRTEVKQFGINVIILQPGAINTEFSEVADKNMVEFQEHSPYADFNLAIKQVYKNLEKPGATSDPSVISEVVLKAIKSPKPKIRYQAGKGSKMAITMRKLLSDSMFDKAITGQFKALAKKAKRQ